MGGGTFAGDSDKIAKKKGEVTALGKNVGKQKIP